MRRPLHVLVLYGGRSAEHEISRLSVKTILKNLDRKRFEAVPVLITKSGLWRYRPEAGREGGKPVPVGLLRKKNRLYLCDTESLRVLKTIDLAFPVLHGPYGEDGRIQGYFESLGLPYAGSGVLGSSLGADKISMKQILKANGIATPKFLPVCSAEEPVSWTAVREKLGSPVLIKPANMGSSIGVSAADSAETLREGLKTAFEFSERALLEEFIEGREIECGVLESSDGVSASDPGEVLTEGDFYSFDKKYRKDSPVRLRIPAALTPASVQKIREISLETFRVLEASGFARIDFFLTKRKKLYVNEINTIPGFTEKSMYTKLWNYSGMTTEALVTAILERGLKRVF